MNCHSHSAPHRARLCLGGNLLARPPVSDLLPSRRPGSSSSPCRLTRERLELPCSHAQVPANGFSGTSRLGPDLTFRKTAVCLLPAKHYTPRPSAGHSIYVRCSLLCLKTELPRETKGVTRTACAFATVNSIFFLL